MFSVLTNEALDRLHAFINTHSERRWEVDEHCRYIDVSQGLLNLFGRERSEVLGRPVYDFMTLNEADRISRIFASKPILPYSEAISHHLRPDGRTIVIESCAVPLKSEDGALKGYRGIAHEVAHLDLLHSDSAYRMKAIYDTVSVALCLLSRDGRYLSANAAYAAIHELLPDALVGRKASELLPGAGEMVRSDLLLMDAGQEVPDHEIECRGRIYLVSVSPLQNLEGQVAGITMALMDITERKRAERKLAETNQQLLHYASHDYLTGLANRRHVDETLAKEVRRAMRERRPLSLLMADADFFKRYNDHYGHLLGDQCLHMVASHLKDAMNRPSDLIGRYGGEEFIAIMPATDKVGALKIAEDVLHTISDLNMPHVESDYGIVTLSIGVATLEPTSQLLTAEANVQVLLSAADRALYEAKAAGRNTISIDSSLQKLSGGLLNRTR